MGAGTARSSMGAALRWCRHLRMPANSLASLPPPRAAEATRQGKPPRAARCRSACSASSPRSAGRPVPRGPFVSMRRVPAREAPPSSSHDSTRGRRRWCPPPAHDSLLRRGAGPGCTRSPAPHLRFRPGRGRADSRKPALRWACSHAVTGLRARRSSRGRRARGGPLAPWRRRARVACALSRLLEPRSTGR